MPSTSISRLMLVRALMGAALLAAAGPLGACAPIQLTRPVFKIGLLAPFEGAGRSTGYEALYAVKLALHEANVSGGVAGWSVELLALDSGAQSATTAQQARVGAADPAMVRLLIVAAAGDRQQVSTDVTPLALPFELIPVESTTEAAPAGAAFVEAYRAISGGITPGDLALRCYAATKDMLAQVQAQIRSAGRPVR